MIACQLLHVPNKLVGAFGVLIGVTLFEPLLRSHVHAPFTAATLNVYVTPFVSHVIVIGLPFQVTRIFPGDHENT